MKNEKLASIALVIIVVAALSVVLLSVYGEDILQNLFEGTEAAPVIELGDCADINYIGRYADNNTIFDSSYQYPENKTGGTPLQIFVSLNVSAPPPEGYDTYSQQFIEGLMEGLVGLEEGEEATIGPIPPEKAYGNNPAAIGDQFTTSLVTASNYGYELDQLMEIINISQDEITIKWANPEDYGMFTMPEGILLEDLSTAFFSLYDSVPPYFLWKNATQIINTTETTVTIETTPNKSADFTDEILLYSIGTSQISAVFPNATTASWTDDAITLTSNPAVGATYSFSSQGFVLDLQVSNVTDDHINLTYQYEGESFPLELNRTITFDRTYTLARTYTVPTYIATSLFMDELAEADISLHELAGKSLVFDVSIEKVYKTSEQ